MKVRKGGVTIDRLIHLPWLSPSFFLSVCLSFCPSLSLSRRCRGCAIAFFFSSSAAAPACFFISADSSIHRKNWMASYYNTPTESTLRSLDFTTARQRLFFAVIFYAKLDSFQTWFWFGFRADSTNNESIQKWAQRWQIRGWNGQLIHNQLEHPVGTFGRSKLRRSCHTFHWYSIFLCLSLSLSLSLSSQVSLESSLLSLQWKAFPRIWRWENLSPRSGGIRTDYLTNLRGSYRDSPRSPAVIPSQTNKKMPMNPTPWENLWESPRSLHNPKHPTIPRSDMLEKNKYLQRRRRGRRIRRRKPSKRIAKNISRNPKNHKDYYLSPTWTGSRGIRNHVVDYLFHNNKEWQRFCLLLLLLLLLLLVYKYFFSLSLSSFFSDAISLQVKPTFFLSFFLSFFLFPLFPSSFPVVTFIPGLNRQCQKNGMATFTSGIEIISL